MTQETTTIETWNQIMQEIVAHELCAIFSPFDYWNKNYREIGDR